MVVSSGQLTSNAVASFQRLDGPAFTLVIDARGNQAPRLVYLGLPLPREADLAQLSFATAIGPRESQPDDRLDLTLLPDAGWGFVGEPAIVIEGGVPCFQLVSCDAGAAALTLNFIDEVAGLALNIEWQVLPTGLLASRAKLTNGGRMPIAVHWLAALALPLPAWAHEVVQVHGRWSGEFRLAATPLRTGKLEKINRTGRSGFDGTHYLCATEAGVTEERGRAIGAHLAWSGNARSLVEALYTGQSQLQLGEWLAPGEIMLAPGDSYETPEALIAISNEGFNGLRRAFHAELRARQAVADLGQSPRKVHFNSWEAVYFDLDQARLIELADRAAALGIERFVLDDGWFLGRRDGCRALGDWTVDPERFPTGLGTFVDRVHGLGMDFGLWVEPEMVSPDSDLYRAHPDWCLHAADRERPTQRHQLVLDLTRPEVTAYLFDALDRLLREVPIAYLKWDHNRDLFPAVSRGRPVVHEQTLAYYALLDRLRAAHPNVEIESCASGGARIDFAVATRAARVWASDNTDAVERLRLHRAMSLFYPPDIIGAHVGASPNPTTGRRLGIDFRARVAMFAHFGVEADPAKLMPAEREALAAHITDYKRWRHLIHSGVQYYIDHDDPGVTAQIIVAADGTEALALAARIDQAGNAVSPPMRLPGLDATACYRVTLQEPWPQSAAHQLGEPDFWRSRPLLEGASLMQVGLRLPVVHPETAWLVHLERVTR